MPREGESRLDFWEYDGQKPRWDWGAAGPVMNSNPFTDFWEFEPRTGPGSPQGGPSRSPLPNESNLDYLTNDSLDSRPASSFPSPSASLNPNRFW